MDTNAVPHIDISINTTGCCPKFNPAGWDGQVLHFRDKPFLRATTASAMHVPLNMGRVFSRVLGKMDKAGASDPATHIVLSRELSPWQAEHLFSVTSEVPDEEQVALSGDFVTRVFEGPYSDMKSWAAEMKRDAKARGGTGETVYFYYTTCPKCAKAYGRNYVVGLAKVN